MTAGYTGNVRVLCAKCVELEEERQLMSFKLECVCEFAYVGDMLDDAGGVEQAVAAKVRAAWMKFRELDGILCM